MFRNLWINPGSFSLNVNHLKKECVHHSQLTQLTTKELLALYQVAHRIPKSKKFQTISQEQLLPVAIDLVRTMIEGAGQQLELVPLHNDLL